MYDPLSGMHLTELYHYGIKLTLDLVNEEYIWFTDEGLPVNSLETAFVCHYWPEN